MNLLCDSVQISNQTSASLEDIKHYAVTCWTYENDVSFDVSKSFNPKRWSKDSDFRGDASEALCLLPSLVAVSLEVKSSSQVIQASSRYVTA